MKKFKILAVLLFLSAVAGCSQKDITYDEAVLRLDKLITKIDWSENFSNKIESISETKLSGAGDMLPDIDKYPIVVYPYDSANSVVVEIFCSTEKSGEGPDGFITEIAEKFNKSSLKTSDGKLAQVAIRKIASGTGYQYISSGKYIPDAFTPSNHLWIEMVRSSGVEVNMIDDQLAENIAGIVMQTDAVEALKTKYKDMDIRNICNAVIQGDIFMGYTNPFASSTGLNFLQSVLMTFSGGDESKMLTDEVKSSFLAFQQGVPFVSLTTLQMRESVEKGGSLDAFVMEYQTYVNTSSMKRGYEFIPFGIKHENPLYSTGNVSAEKTNVLKLFSQFVKKDSSQKIATKYGFNPELNYTPEYKSPSGETLILAQKLWKTEKDTGNPIVAVFLTDTSGSMNGAPINSLKDALIAGCEFIDEKNYIGLATFDSTVVKLLPVKQFNKMQKQRFISSVKTMEANGSTAMFDGILVSAQMITEVKKQLPKCKPIIFVLTDGDTNSGYRLGKVQTVLKGLNIPIYTIGYGYNNDTLKTVSSINEAANLNAQEDDIVYQIGELLNAEM
ncbi:MAG: VWA domain-containing protein [Spirochaetes bacterium]|nr:VWA domain-containing protein [Spirochaetota bacterium]